MDYTQFLPGDLEESYDRIRTVYTLAVTELDDAYLHPALSGVDMKTPSLVLAKNIFNTAGLNLIPSCRDIVSYTALVVSLAPAFQDPKSLADTLLPVASLWQTVDSGHLTEKAATYARIFGSYYPILAPVINDLSSFHHDLLQPIDKTKPPSWWTRSLFDTLTPLLAPIATFSPGTVGHSTLAGLLQLTVEQVSTPLCKVIGNKLTLEDVGASVETHLLLVLRKYRNVTLARLSIYFDALVNIVSLTAKERKDVVKRLEGQSHATVQSASSGTSADQCVAAWNGASDAADALISVIAGGKTDRPMRSIKPFTLLSADGSGGTVQAVKVIADMKAILPQVSSKLDQISALPLVDFLKVVDSSPTQSEKSAGTIISSCKTKYFALQDTIRALVSDFNAYSLLMKFVTPVLGKTPFDDFATRVSPLADSFRRTAELACTLSQEILDELTLACNSLHASVDNANTSFNKIQLSVAQQTSDQTVANTDSEIYDISHSLFTSAMVGAFITETGPLASCFPSYGRIPGVDKLSVAIKTSTMTVQSLQVALAFFQQINQLMRQATAAWNGLLTPLASSDLLFLEKDSASWKALQGETQSYFDTTRDSAKSMEAYGPDVSSLEATLNKSTMTIEETSNLFKAMLSANDARNLEIGLSPPEGMTLGVNRNTLNGISSDYRNIASILRLQFSSLASEADRLASTVTGQLIPKLGRVVNFYIAFAQGQEDPFAGGLTKAKLEAIVEKRWEQLEQGENLAKEAETTFLQFNWDAQNALNNITRRMNEMDQQISAKEREVRALQADYDKWKWMQYLPGGGFVWLILDSIMNVRGQIDDLRRQISSLRDGQRALSSAQYTSSRIQDTVSTLSAGWSTLTTNTEVLKQLVKAYERDPALEQALKPVVSAKWKAFEGEMSQW